MSQQRFSVYQEQCPSRNVLEKISNKWSILIINILLNKTLRFGELKREINGISAKVLTETLIKLESLGFISREEFSGLPMKVEYALTPLGRELGILLNVLTGWTEKNMDAILLAESKFKATYVL